MAEEDEKKAGEALDAALKSYGVRHVVIGHTAVLSQFVQLKANSGIIMIDVFGGLSGAGAMPPPVGKGSPVCLLIENGKFYSVTPEE
jgi:hypothetical protein